MALVVRAVYEAGVLRPLEPLKLNEGQEIVVTIAQDERALLKAILGDMVQWSNPDDDSDAWVEDMADEIAQALSQGPSLSQMIIEEREKGW